MTDQNKEPEAIAIGVGVQTSPQGAWTKWPQQIEHAAKLGDPLHFIPEGTTPNPDGSFETVKVYPRGESYKWERESDARVGAMRDATGRMDYMRYLVQINTPEMRAIAGDKAEFAKLFPEVAIPTVMFESGKAIDEVALADLPGDVLVVKPTKGWQSKGVKFTTKSEFDATAFEGGGYVVQPFIDNTNLPAGIRGASPEGDQNIRDAKGAKEIRMFTGLHINNGRPIPLIKLAKGSDPTMAQSFYVSPDPDSIPQACYQIAIYTAEKLKRLTGDGHIFAAVDLIYDAQRDDYYVMEVNVNEPALPRPGRHPQGLDVHHGLVELLRYAVLLSRQPKL